MGVVQIALRAVFFLGAAALGGALVLLAIATRLIESALKGRRTEGRQIVRRLRGAFQRIELIALAALWASGLARLLLARLLPEVWPGEWGPADAIAIGILAVLTVAAAYSTFYLTRAIKRRETQLGSYADKNRQIKVRKSIAVLHAQAQLLTWAKAALVALLVVAASAGAPRARARTAATRPAATAPTRTPTTRPAPPAPPPALGD